MSKLIEKINKEQIRTDIPEFRVGDTVRVDVWVKEGKKRTTHREMMEEILEKTKQPKIDYSIINSLYFP